MGAVSALLVGLLLHPARAAAGEPVDPASRLPAGGSASEYWDLAAHFQSGQRLYARVFVTNAGPGERSAAAFGHFVQSDGTPVFFKNGRRKARWTLGADGRRLEIGSTLLDQSGPTRRFHVRKKHRGIQLLLDYPADPLATSAPEGPGGYRLDLLNLATPVKGSVWLAARPEEVPLEGHITVTHAWIGSPERDVIARRLDVSTLGASPHALFLTDLTTPKGERWQWVAIRTGDAAQLSGPAFGVNFVPREASDSRYPVPARLELTGPDLSGSIPLGEPLLESNPLDALPGFLKMVYSFVAQPRRIWSDAAVDLALKPGPGRAALQIRGPGTASVTFPNPLPKKLRSTPAGSGG